MKSGPERTLVEDYVTRFDRTGRPLSLGPLEMVEVEDRKGGGKAAEAMLLQRAASGADLVCILDERGKALSSPDFSKHLSDWRDQGLGSVAFLIGGADGLTPELRKEAGFALSFGAMVWPHMLVRVMLTEQLYRAASILAGTPYHRA